MTNFPLKVLREIKKQNFVDKNQGLLNGNMGLAIFLYQLSFITKDHEIDQMADELLDRIFDNLTTFTSADFENGLAGIGWGIEYFIENGFSEGNPDEILWEIDNKVFQILNCENLYCFDLSIGLTGYLFYLNKRLKDCEFSQSLVYKINKELFILIINKLEDLVTSQFQTIFKEHWCLLKNVNSI